MVFASRFKNRIDGIFKDRINAETEVYICETPQATFDLGEKFGERLRGGEIVLLSGGLGAGKTLFTKGILHALDYDVDEVTSPSFTLG